MLKCYQFFILDNWVLASLLEVKLGKAIIFLINWILSPPTHFKSVQIKNKFHFSGFINLLFLSRLNVLAPPGYIKS